MHVYNAVVKTLQWEVLPPKYTETMLTSAVEHVDVALCGAVELDHALHVVALLWQQSSVTTDVNTHVGRALIYNWCAISRGDRNLGRLYRRHTGGKLS
jgi:hypothetical protein